MKKTVSLFAIGASIFVLIIIFYYLNTNCSIDSNRFLSWFLRVIVSLSVSIISVIIPGFIGINISKEDMPSIQQTDYKVYSITDKHPKIVSYGAIAIFIIVYLFNPF